MPVGFRIVRGHVRAERSLVEAFAEIPAAIVSDNMNRMYGGGANLRPLHKGGVLAGTALTVRCRPGDNLMVHKAADVAEPGDVIVVDAGGDLTNAIIGELIVRHARSRGVVGLVVNGAARDMDALAADTFPVYAAGVTHRGPYKDGPGEINVPIDIGGMTVNPGDIMLGDADGVLAIPRIGAETILEAARAQQAKEADILKAIETGSWDRRWVDETLKAKGFTEE
ncbi:RraA family protein [Oceanibaculum pacificum]|uniref:Putative 4-hydroxy-4-methyl-2-oxoglutarate aldolase n=1 Tax=Oceanibaculum pacificum TaxID=580166 RepID=A0A154VIC4_9PROT|nr:RraA family protein [Oceanibaculum pacificum]KZD01056.1 methyltransferase [Oceanibaculum pacificum]